MFYLINYLKNQKVQKLPKMTRINNIIPTKHNNIKPFRANFNLLRIKINLVINFKAILNKP